jgi:myosin heavy subunit
LNPKKCDELKDSKDPKNTANAILEVTGLDEELYRLGNTKA